ncbi:NAD(P)/FAD-dependent oxidoreductase [Nannocystaceae bacterium ST9]
MQQVEHLIIGAGIAGLVLRHFLTSERVVIVDPEPAGYKIGESLIPELFRHPELAALLPRIQALPSYTPKYGTTFVAHGEVALFPIGAREIGEAMHVARSELEGALIEAWNIEVVRARVTSIDFERKRVTTSAGEFEVSGLIFDCSGPAMLVASMLGEVEKLLPVHATWAYYDVIAEHPEALVRAIADQGLRYLQYDVRHRQAVPTSEVDMRQIVRTTYLSQVADGIWTWQIPLFRGRVLSYGVVSRHGPVGVDEYREIAERTHAPHFELRRRPAGADAFDRVHERNGFARQAKRPADRDFILLADAFGFSDPVYSVGTGFAVSQAIEVATLINRGDWSRETCEAYVARCRETLARARKAFDFWYSGAVLHDPVVASEVQHDFLLGGLFHAGITRHYGAAIELASLASERDPFEAAWEGPELSAAVIELLGLDEGKVLAGWSLLGARPCAGGIQLRWSGHGLPELTMLIADDAGGAQPCFRRAGPLALSYMQLFDRGYPQVPALAALFDGVSGKLVGHEQRWLGLGASASA